MLHVLLLFCALVLFFSHVSNCDRRIKFLLLCMKVFEGKVFVKEKRQIQVIDV